MQLCAPMTKISYNWKLYTHLIYLSDWCISTQFQLFFYAVSSMLSKVTDAPPYMQHNLKTLNLFKKFSTTCFGLYGHHDALKLLCGNCCAHLVLFLVRSHVCASISLSDGLLSLCVTMPANCFLVVASMVDVSLPLGSRTVPGLSYQLLISHS
jgi:hypothetical protein